MVKASEVEGEVDVPVVGVEDEGKVLGSPRLVVQPLRGHQSLCPRGTMPRPKSPGGSLSWGEL